MIKRLLRVEILGIKSTQLDLTMSSRSIHHRRKSPPHHPRRLHLPPLSTGSHILSYTRLTLEWWVIHHRMMEFLLKNTSRQSSSQPGAHCEPKPKSRMKVRQSNRGK